MTEAFMIDVLQIVSPILCAISGIVAMMALVNRRYTNFVYWTLIGAVAFILPLFLPSKKTSSETNPASPIAEAPAPAASSPSTTDVPWELLGFVAVILTIIGAVAIGIIFVVPHIKKNTNNKSENIRAWKTLVNRHEKIRAQWVAYEMDMDKLIDMPVMTDMREPVIIALHKALKTASSLVPKSLDKFAYTPVKDSAFLAAVNDLEVALNGAEQTAKKIAWSKFTKEERRSLSTAKQMLSLATDAGASPAERQAAYKRVFKELQGLIEFPAKARLEIESRHQLSLAA